ncbi:MAG: hypothetical protein GYB65_10965 [Chloroflexi bacterium]|nr:hypothetical protein [Chloroflexota bacterium]
MDFIENLLGIERTDSVTDLVQNLWRWILGCGCLIVIAIGGLIALLVGGVISFGDQAVVVIIVIGAIIAAVFSLIRSSIGGREY